jgi:hypothetical protein
VCSCCAQHPSVHWLVFCQYHRWSSTATRSEQRSAWLWRCTYYRYRHVFRYAVRIQDRPRVRVLELDPMLHCLPYRFRRVCPLWCKSLPTDSLYIHTAYFPLIEFFKSANGRWQLRSRFCSLLCRIRIRIRYRLDELRR